MTGLDQRLRGVLSLEEKLSVWQCIAYREKSKTMKTAGAKLFNMQNFRQKALQWRQCAAVLPDGETKLYCLENAESLERQIKSMQRKSKQDLDDQ
jgi:hypothetical protein